MDGGRFDDEGLSSIRDAREMAEQEADEVESDQEKTGLADRLPCAGTTESIEALRAGGRKVLACVREAWVFDGCPMWRRSRLLKQ